MRQSDSGLIDLVAIDRAARVARQLDTPSAAPITRDLSDDEVDVFAKTLARSRTITTRIKVACGGALAAIVIAIVAAGSGSDGSSKPASAAAAAPALPARATFVPVENALPTIPSMPAATPTPTLAAAPSRALAAAEPAPKPALAKAHRSATAPRKPQRKGPKLTKVTSSGVTS